MQGMLTCHAMNFFVDFVQGACKKLHLLVERIDMNSIPVEEEEIKKWLFQRYVHKDK